MLSNFRFLLIMICSLPSFWFMNSGANGLIISSKEFHEAASSNEKLAYAEASVESEKNDSIPKRRPPENDDRSSESSSRAANFNSGFNEAAFISALEGEGCFVVNSITVNSINASNQTGTFNNGIAGAGLQIDEGIILTTGRVNEAFTTNSSTGISQGGGGSNQINDPDLDAMAINGSPTFNEAIIEIDFTLIEDVDGFKIPFQFASDEYNEYVCSGFNDVFSVFIKGPGIPIYQSISLVPGNSNPIAINYLNNGSCGSAGSGEPSDLTQSALFISNQSGAIISEYDGFTVKLDAKEQGLQAGNYQLKLAIADVGDRSYDSGVFFGAMGAVSGGVDITCDCVNFPLANPLGDCDQDGVLNGNEVDASAALDPCSPNPFAVPTGDCDGDGILNQDEVNIAAALDPCNPDPLGSSVGDCDGDGVTNQLEANAEEAMNACLPNLNAVPTGDCDGDGVQNSIDQCPLIAGVAPSGCPDFDLDGVEDGIDLDDDNDGVLDTEEWANAQYTLLPIVGTNAINSGSWPNLNNPALNSSSSWSAPNNNAGQFTGVTFPGPCEVISFTTQGRANANQWVRTYRVELTKDNSNWISIGDFTGNTNRNGQVTHIVDNDDQDWVAMRIIPLTFRSWKSMRFSVDIIDQLAYDLDQDGFPNHQDLDTDGDGCSDAFEAGATADFSSNFSFPSTTTSGDPNGNGLANVVEQGNTGQINYTSTYQLNALDASTNVCDDVCIIEDCDGDGFTNDEELAGICGFTADPYDFNSPFEHWETTQSLTLLDNLFILETVNVPSFFNSSPVSHLTVNAGHVLTLTSDIIVRDLTINSGATLDLAGQQISVHGDLIVDGEIIHEKGHILMVGTCQEQFIRGSSTDLVLHELTIQNALGVTLDMDLKVSGPIHPERGTFFINGNELVLISLPIDGEISTGSISEIKLNADVLGPITLQRYVESLEDGYRFLGPPLKDLTIADIADDMVTTGFPGSDYPNHYFTNLKHYQEDQRDEDHIQSGYKDVENVNEAWEENQGYWAYFPPSTTNVLLDATGEFNKGEVTYDVTYTDTGSPQCDGWHCIVNPYPSAVDLQSSCMSFNNISETIYILDHTIGGTWQGEYVVYNNGISVNGGNSVIASFQAFMVQATGPGASITFNECAKTDEQGIFYRSEEEEDKSFIRLALQRDEDAYETVIAFNEDATTSYDAELDGRRWHAQMFSIASVLDGDTLSLNNVPLDQGDLEIPLLISAPEAGQYELLITELKNLPSTACMFISDVETGEIMLVEEGASLILNTEEDSFYEERYMLNYKSIAALEIEAPACYEGDSGYAEVTLLNNEVAEFEWYDFSETLIHQDSGSASSLDNLTAGTYLVQVNNDSSVCQTSLIEVIVGSTEPEVVEISSTPDFCSGGFGSVKVNVMGAENWNVTVLNGFEEVAQDSSDVLVDIENLSGAVYDIIVETPCSTEQYVVDLSDPDAVKANFENPGQVLIQNVGVEVEIEALSENADNHEWFLDEYFQGDEEFISLTFDQVGSYQLRLNSSNEYCDDDFEQELMVSAASVIEENIDKDFLTINRENQIEILRLNDRSGSIDITLYDIKGSKVEEYLASNKNRIIIDKQRLNTGIYILEIRTQSGQILSSKHAK